MEILTQSSPSPSNSSSQFSSIKSFQVRVWARRNGLKDFRSYFKQYEKAIYPKSSVISSRSCKCDWNNPDDDQNSHHCFSPQSKFTIYRISKIIKYYDFEYLNHWLFGNTIPNIRFREITIRLKDPDRKNVTGIQMKKVINISVWKLWIDFYL